MGSSDSFVEVIGGRFFVVDDALMPQQHTCGTDETQDAGPEPHNPSRRETNHRANT
jgi:hypothetical protein